MSIDAPIINNSKVQMASFTSKQKNNERRHSNNQNLQSENNAIHFEQKTKQKNNELQHSNNQFFQSENDELHFKIKTKMKKERVLTL